MDLFLLSFSDTLSALARIFSHKFGKTGFGLFVSYYKTQRKCKCVIRRNCFIAILIICFFLLPHKFSNEFRSLSPKPRFMCVFQAPHRPRSEWNSIWITDQKCPLNLLERKFKSANNGNSNQIIDSYIRFERVFRLDRLLLRNWRRT